MTVHALWVINKAGGLVFSRSYSGERLFSNAYSHLDLSRDALPILCHPCRISLCRNLYEQSAEAQSPLLLSSRLPSYWRHAIWHSSLVMAPKRRPTRSCLEWTSSLAASLLQMTFASCAISIPDISLLALARSSLLARSLIYPLHFPIHLLPPSSFPSSSPPRGFQKPSPLSR